MENKTAIIAGASGLIGRSLTQQLLNSDQYSKVISLVRKPLGFVHPKYSEVIIDFNTISDFADFPKGEDIFCCLGTTMKNAGSKEAFFKVDYTYCYDLAKRGLQAGADRYFLVSAMGANPKSSNFYSRVKGELEDQLSFLGYRTIYVFKPSLLRGNREEFRLGEKLALIITRIIPFVGALRKYKPIHVDKVADAMVKVAKQDDKGFYYYQSDIMQKM